MNSIEKFFTGVGMIFDSVFGWLFEQQAQEVQAPAIPTTPLADPVPHLSKIELWANEINIQEGGNPGNPNVVNCNPGNIRCSKYTFMLGKPGHQAVRCTPGGFLVFNTKEDGHDALVQFLTECCQGEWIPYRGLDILQFTKVYAEPPNDNYGNAVALAMNVPVTTPISALI